jgi:two-component system, LytTR family, sensor kinase
MTLVTPGLAASTSPDSAQPGLSSPGLPRVVFQEPPLPWGPVLAGVSGLALCTALQLALGYRMRGVDLSIREAILSGAATWFPWVALAPLIFRICVWFPFDPGRWRRSVLAHLPACFAIGLLYSAMRWSASYVPWVDEKPFAFWRVAISHMYLWLLSYWVLVGVHEAWHNYQRFKQGELRASQLEARLAQAQLEVLKGQLHPHFLFNTLHAISTLIHKDPDSADEMVAQLSDLLRMTLANIGVQEVPLQQELEFLRRYLDIQQMRFQDRLRVVVDVPADTLDVKVPNQVLQPLVENAIRHGVDARRGEGLIEIRARAEGATLTLSVRDDGPGLRPEALKGGRAQGRGIGLSNTRARLRELYGPVSMLELANHPAGGTLVSLSIPLRRDALA